MRTEIKKKEQTMMCAEELKINNVKNKKLNSQTVSKTSGITLIALVVTIVVLLILAGITISLVFSENGIIAKAKEAAEKTNQAAINEQEQMNEVDTTINNMLNGTGGSGEEPTPPEPEGCPVEEFEKWNKTSNDKINAVESADKVVVPVPKGYTASSLATENKVSEGFVIYEGEEVVNDSNKDAARTTRNQFVWVPVANPSDMYGKDENCKKWGKSYNFSASGITAENWTEQDGIMSVTSATSYREPDVVTGNGTEYDAVNSNLQQAGLDSSATASTFKTQLETEFNNMIASVERYGGFYIGRYESGIESGKILVQANKGPYTWKTQARALTEAKEFNSSLNSSLLTGAAWDRVLGWLYENGNKTKSEIAVDSLSWGNYKSTVKNTGTSNNAISNNIYDIAGNVSEWTTELWNGSEPIARRRLF